MSCSAFRSSQCHGQFFTWIGLLQLCFELLRRYGRRSRLPGVPETSKCEDVQSPLPLCSEYAPSQCIYIYNHIQHGKLRHGIAWWNVMRVDIHIKSLIIVQRFYSRIITSGFIVDSFDTWCQPHQQSNIHASMCFQTVQSYIQSFYNTVTAVCHRSLCAHCFG